MSGVKTKRPRSDLTRPVRSEWALIELGGSVSPRPDGERVCVVGEDRPAGPDLAALVTFEPGSAHAVAAFEVADPAFGASSVARESSLGASGPGLLTAGDEHSVRGEAAERLAGRPEVRRQLPHLDRQRLVPQRLRLRRPQRQHAHLQDRSETHSLAGNSDRHRGQNKLRISPTYSAGSS